MTVRLICLPKACVERMTLCSLQYGMAVRGIDSRVGVHVVLQGHTKLSRKLKHLPSLVLIYSF
jgi:hypothetical protein